MGVSGANNEEPSMKSRQRSLSTTVVQHRAVADTTAQPTCRTCGQLVDTLADRLSGLDEATIDMPRLLQLAQQLYAHALTLQELMWSGGEAKYEAVRPKYELQAAEQFEVFYQTPKRPSGVRSHGTRPCGRTAQQG